MIRAVGCSARTGDRVDAAVSAVAQDWPGAVEQMGDGAAGHDDIIAVTGPARANGYDAAVVGVDEDLGVDAGAVVLTDRGDRLVVHRDEGVVDDPRVCAAVGSGAQHGSQPRYQVVDDPVQGGLAGGEQGGQCACGQVGAQINQHQQYRHGQRQSPGAPSSRWDLVGDLLRAHYG